MKTQIRKGFAFGLTSGVITTLGLIIGLDASTGSRFAVIAGIFAIAVADAFSDAFGMHISEESTYYKTGSQLWEATIATFVFKLLFALTFVIPFFLTTLTNAIFICIAWGMILISGYSYHLAKKRNSKPYKVIAEHILITIVVIAASYGVGKLTAMFIS